MIEFIQDRMEGEHKAPLYGPKSLSAGLRQIQENSTLPSSYYLKTENTRHFPSISRKFDGVPSGRQSLLDAAEDVDNPFGR